MAQPYLCFLFSVSQFLCEVVPVFHDAVASETICSSPVELLLLIPLILPGIHHLSQHLRLHCWFEGKWEGAYPLQVSLRPLLISDRGQVCSTKEGGLCGTTDSSSPHQTGYLGLCVSKLSVVIETGGCA